MVATRFRWHALEVVVVVGSALNIAVEKPIVWVPLVSDLSTGLLGQWTIWWIFSLTASLGSWTALVEASKIMFLDSDVFERVLCCGGIYVFFSDRSSLWQASGRGSHPLILKLCINETIPVGQCDPRQAKKSSNRDCSQQGTAMVCIVIKWCSLHRVVTMHISACIMCTIPCAGVNGPFKIARYNFLIDLSIYIFFKLENGEFNTNILVLGPGQWAKMFWFSERHSEGGILVPILQPFILWRMQREEWDTLLGEGKQR